MHTNTIITIDIMNSAMTFANSIITREHITVIGIMFAEFITVKSLDTHA